MGLIYENSIRPRLFRLDPERAHELAVRRDGAAGRVAPVCRVLEAWARLPADACRPVECLRPAVSQRGGPCGRFRQERAWPGRPPRPSGSATWRSARSPRWRSRAIRRPRVFRYPEHEAVINRMGFNNEGAEAVARRLRPAGPPGRAADPARDQPRQVEGAPTSTGPREDYLASFATAGRPRRLHRAQRLQPEHARACGSCRRRPGCGSCCGGHAANANARAGGRGAARVPLLLKIAPGPDFSPDRRGPRAWSLTFGLDGIIATNTTLGRPGAVRRRLRGGRPERRARWAALDRNHPLHCARHERGGCPIIGVGRHHGCRERRARNWMPGAALVQIYTGMIYRGPFFARGPGAAALPTGSDRLGSRRSGRSSDHPVPVSTCPTQRIPSSAAAG